ncbi:MAG: hypothetical protein OXS35_06200, partial [Dehalococcoidia bacterium]|nr:hypothetical protein [Dehalococcoidia bacterium]
AFMAADSQAIPSKADFCPLGQEVAPSSPRGETLQEEGVALVVTVVAVVLLPMDVEGMVGTMKMGKTPKGQAQVVVVVAITDQRKQPTAAAEDRMVS